MNKVRKKSSTKTVLKLENGIELRVDQMSWMIYTPSPRGYLYFSTLDGVMSELLNLRIKELAGNDKRKTVESLAEAITKAHQEIKQIINTLTTLKTSDQSRLEAFELVEKSKDIQ